MTNVDTYEGWTNRETWAVALWINNDREWQESVHEAIRAEWTAGHFSADQPHRVGEIVQQNVEDTLDRDDIGIMWRVDWSEIGAAFLTDALEGVDA